MPRYEQTQEGKKVLSVSIYQLFIDKFLPREELCLIKEAFPKNACLIQNQDPWQTSLSECCLINTEWNHDIQNCFGRYSQQDLVNSFPFSATGRYTPVYPIFKWPSPWSFQEVAVGNGRGGELSILVFEGEAALGTKN